MWSYLLLLYLFWGALALLLQINDSLVSVSRTGLPFTLLLSGIYCIGKRGKLMFMFLFGFRARLSNFTRRMPLPVAEICLLQPRS